mgnify:CR=1 FL=1
MQAIQQAIESGYTHVATLAGFVSLWDWQPVNNIQFDAENGRFVGDWRELSTLEEMICDQRGLDMQYSRDTWQLSSAAGE